MIGLAVIVLYRFILAKIEMSVLGFILKTVALMMAAMFVYSQYLKFFGE